jgi:small subunit ribosomal protein S4e
MTHLKRYSMPVSWPVPRKKETFVVRPDPGPHPMMECLPLRIVLRDMLGYAENAKETRSILSQEKLLVDKRPRKRSRFPVGLMDVIEISQTNDYFRLTVGPKGLGLEKIPKQDAAWKLCKITGKITLKKGVQQLNLHDGRNILVKKDSYKVGDSIQISLPDQKILKHLKLDKGSHALIVAGRNRGASGRIKEIEERMHMLEKPTVTIETGGKEIKTPREYIFITEKPAPAKPKKEPAPAKPKKEDKQGK